VPFPVCFAPSRCSTGSDLAAGTCRMHYSDTGAPQTSDTRRRGALDATNHFPAQFSLIFDHSWSLVPFPGCFTPSTCSTGLHPAAGTFRMHYSGTDAPQSSETRRRGAQNAKNHFPARFSLIFDRRGPLVPFPGCFMHSTCSPGSQLASGYFYICCYLLSACLVFLGDVLNSLIFFFFFFSFFFFLFVVFAVPLI
jgi:hypothetical protein